VVCFFVESSAIRSPDCRLGFCRDWVASAS
jgi:hypothetical protein